MTLDIPTVILVVAFIDALCGVILLSAYFMFFRGSQAALWWGASHIMLAAGVIISMAGASLQSDPVTATAFAFFLSSAAAQWYGTRLLTGSRSHLWLVLVGPILIIAVNLLPVGAALPMVRGISAGVLNLAYFISAIYALMRPSSERLRGYLPLAMLFVANVIVVGLAPFGGLGSSDGGMPPIFSLLGLIYIESHLFVLGTTIFVIAALREGKEMAERKQAVRDDLTGLPNRRGFSEMGDRLIARCYAEGKPIGVAVIDLDNFKSVNDRFGHAMGDAVLKRFALVAQSALRNNDVIGRVGGEEFAMLLHGSDTAASAAIVERIRRAFQAEAEFIDGIPVRATLCAGVAGANTKVSLESLLKDADIALYRAKNSGRNRVQTLTPLETTDVTITHVA
ncbi:MAG TPA: diguanylate cyclase [Asticcacaulis sp.]|nr:diguanylate cyclase [Asticcacaulis sp.]